MQIDVERQGKFLNFSRRLEPDDEAYTPPGRGRIGLRNITTELHDANQEIHPDLVALGCLVSSEIFAAKNIRLNFAVSETFSATISEHFRKNIGPTSPDLTPRGIPVEGRPGLAFSGGIDSCAALALLPDDTVAIFMNRITPEGVKRGLYREDAALASCEAVLQSGKHVAVLASSLEHGREPVGFPVDWANGLPAILSADHFNLNSLAFGTVLESVYRVGDKKFSELSTRKIWSAWSAAFSAAGLPLNLPVGSLSEVNTARLAQMPQVSRWRPQSCVRGTDQKPCGRCFKCFRKGILDAALRRESIPATHFDIFLSSNEVQKKILDMPIHHENVLSYSVQNILPVDHPVYRALAAKTAPAYRTGLEYLDRYYPDALQYVPDHLRSFVSEKIAAYVAAMTPEECAILRAWDTSSIVLDDQYIAGQSMLEQQLN